MPSYPSPSTLSPNHLFILSVIHPSSHLFIKTYTLTHLSTYSSICLYICIHPSILLSSSIYSSIHPNCLFIYSLIHYLFLYPSTHPYIYLSVPPTLLFICSPTDLSTLLSIYPSMFIHPSIYGPVINCIVSIFYLTCARHCAVCWARRK